MYEQTSKAKSFPLILSWALLEKYFHFNKIILLLLLTLIGYILDQLELELSRNSFRNWSRIVNIVSYVQLQNESTNSSKNQVFNCIHGFGSIVGPMISSQWQVDFGWFFSSSALSIFSNLKFHFISNNEIEEI